MSLGTLPIVGNEAGGKIAAIPVIDVDTAGNAVPAGTAASPTNIKPAPSGAAQVTGTFSATGVSASFTAVPGFDVWLTLFCTVAAVQTIVLERSTDAGTTWLQLTSSAGLALGSYAVNASGAATILQAVVSSEADSGALYRLRCSAYTSGTVAYRLGTI